MDQINVQNLTEKSESVTNASVFVLIITGVLGYFEKRWLVQLIAGIHFLNIVLLFFMMPVQIPEPAEILYSKLIRLITLDVIPYIDEILQWLTNFDQGDPISPEAERIG